MHLLVFISYLINLMYGHGLFKIVRMSKIDFFIINQEPVPVAARSET